MCVCVCASTHGAPTAARTYVRVCVSQCTHWHLPNQTCSPLQGTLAAALAPPRVLLGLLLPNAMETHRSFCNTNSRLNPAYRHKLLLAERNGSIWSPADKKHASNSVCARRSITEENHWSISLTTQKKNSRRYLHSYTQHTHMLVVVRAQSLRMLARGLSPRVQSQI